METGHSHTVHLILAAARRLFHGTGLRVVGESDTVEEVKGSCPSLRIRHMGDRLKRLLFKNVVYETIAVRPA